MSCDSYTRDGFWNRLQFPFMGINKLLHVQILSSLDSAASCGVNEFDKKTL